MWHWTPLNSQVQQVRNHGGEGVAVLLPDVEIEVLCPDGVIDAVRLHGGDRRVETLPKSDIGLPQAHAEALAEMLRGIGGVGEEAAAGGLLASLQPFGQR